MASLPLVSIVTPSYNQSGFLEETMRSVLHQDYPNIEDLVIDGGSTDGSLEIIRKYEDRLAYWVSEPDKGQADAINKGWTRCRGDIIAFLNSDDYYLPGAVSNVVRAFQRNPDVDFVCGQAQWVSEQGAYLQTTDFRVDGSDTWELFDLYRQTSVPQPAAFVRRRVLDKIGMLDPSFHFGLDGEFYLRVLTNFKAIALPDSLACMRLHDTSKSVGSGMGFAPEVLRIAHKIIASPQDYPKSKVNPNKILAAAHIISARSYYVNGAHRDAVRHLLASARLSTAYWMLIAYREIPRMVARILIGKQAYARVSSFSRRGRLTGKER